MISEIIQSENILYLFSIIFAILSVLYFTRDILESLSMTVKSITLYSISIIVFLISTLSTYPISSFLVILCVSLYSFTTLYVWKVYKLGKVGRIFILATSSFILLLLGYITQNNIANNLSLRIIIILSLVLILIDIILIVIDIKSEEIKYSLNLNNPINIEGEKTIANIKILNNSHFKRKVKRIRLNCYLKNKSKKTKIPYNMDNYDNINRKSQEKIDITVNFDRIPDNALSELDVNLRDHNKLNVEKEKSEDKRKYEINLIIND